MLALALWRRPVNAQANRVLAGWVALIGIDLAVKAVYFDGPAPELLKAYRLVSLLPFLYGALFYLYVRALTEARALQGRDLLHMTGFAIALAVNAAAWAASSCRTRRRIAPSSGTCAKAGTGRAGPGWTFCCSLTA